LATIGNRCLGRLIGNKAHHFEITKDGQKAFLFLTYDGLNPPAERLNQNAEVLEHCARVAQDLPVAAKTPPDSNKPLEAEARSKTAAESFISKTRLASCAASGSRFAAFFVTVLVLLQRCCH
jgi:hypothetical protein